MTNLKNDGGILIIRFDALGDSLVSLPFIKAVSDIWPEEDIFVVASKRGSAAFDGISFIDGVFECDPSSSEDMRKLLIKVSERRFSKAFILSEKIYAYNLAFKTQIPMRCGFDPGISKPFKSLMCKWLLTSRAFCEVSRTNSSLHEVERQFLLLESLGYKKEPEGYKIPVSDVLNNSTKGTSKECKKIAVHLSNKWLNCGWSFEFVARLIKELSFLGVYVFATYGEPEKNVAKKLSELIPRLNLFGNLSFKEWVALLSESSAVVTMDTSASHVAAGLSIPSVVVFEEEYFKHTLDRWHPWKSKFKAFARKNISGFSENERKKEEGELVGKISEAVAYLLRGSEKDD